MQKNINTVLELGVKPLKTYDTPQTPQAVLVDTTVPWQDRLWTVYANGSISIGNFNRFVRFCFRQVFSFWRNGDPNIYELLWFDKMDHDIMMDRLLDMNIKLGKDMVASDYVDIAFYKAVTARDPIQGGYVEWSERLINTVGAVRSLLKEEAYKQSMEMGGLLSPKIFAEQVVIERTEDMMSYLSNLIGTVEHE